MLARLQMTAMKKILVLTITAILLVPLAGFSQKKLEYRDGLYYKNGMLYSGIHKEYHDNGKISMETSIMNGKEHGMTVFYYRDGTKKEVRSYFEGAKHGLWVTWNEKGVKTAEARYKMGKKDGYWYIWDDNGQKRYEMFYRDGEKAGTWYMWDEEGNLVNERKYS